MENSGRNIGPIVLFFAIIVAFLNAPTFAHNKKWDIDVSTKTIMVLGGFILIATFLFLLVRFIKNRRKDKG